MKLALSTILGDFNKALIYSAESLVHTVTNIQQ